MCLLISVKAYIFIPCAYGLEVALFGCDIFYLLNLTPLLTSCFPLSKTRQQCFSDASTRRPSDLLSSFTTIKTVMNNLYDGLGEVLLILLKNTDTRENVLEYLAEVINKNASRAHIQVTFFCILPF